MNINIGYSVESTTISSIDNNITINNTYVNLKDNNGVDSTIKVKANDKIYYDYHIITVKGKPSCQSCHHKYKYRWYTRSWINYCPHCKRYNCLQINPKRVHEGELTCKYCDSDYCINCGHDKCANYYRHKNYQLIRA